MWLEFNLGHTRLFDSFCRNVISFLIGSIDIYLTTELHYPTIIKKITSISKNEKWFLLCCEIASGNRWNYLTIVGSWVSGRWIDRRNGIVNCGFFWYESSSFYIFPFARQHAVTWKCEYVVMEWVVETNFTLDTVRVHERKWWSWAGH